MLIFTITAEDYFYPRSPCGERQLLQRSLSAQGRNFYPRSPCGERPPSTFFYIILQNFYPRSPCGERRVPLFYNNLCQNFYPRSPCGERRGFALAHLFQLSISIHALLAESDLTAIGLILGTAAFLSTLSLRRATAKVHKTVGHFCAYETNFMGIASSY